MGCYLLSATAIKRPRITFDLISVLVLSVSGTINTIGTVDLEFGSPLYGITGINVDFADLFEVILTPTSSDDLSIIRDMLIGDDEFYLSDEADLARGFDGNDIMYGYSGDDTLDGGDGDDKIYGGAGDDIIINTGGEDLFDGGDGVDTLITNLSLPVKEILGSGPIN